MNCRPGQRAIIVRPACAHECVGKRLGAPVQVVSILIPVTISERYITAHDGPQWFILDPLSCPDSIPCKAGIDFVPDKCLQPLPDDSDAAVEDVRSEAPVSHA